MNYSFKAPHFVRHFLEPRMYRCLVQTCFIGFPINRGVQHTRLAAP